MTTVTELSIRSRSRGKSFLRSAFDNIVEARQRQAERHVAGTLAMIRREARAADQGSLLDAQAPERG